MFRCANVAGFSSESFWCHFHPFHNNCRTKINLVYHVLDGTVVASDSLSAAAVGWRSVVHFFYIFGAKQTLITAKSVMKIDAIKMSISIDNSFDIFFSASILLNFTNPRIQTLFDIYYRNQFVAKAYICIISIESTDVFVIMNRKQCRTEGEEHDWNWCIWSVARKIGISGLFLYYSQLDKQSSYATRADIVFVNIIFNPFALQLISFINIASARRIWRRQNYNISKWALRSKWKLQLHKTIN